MEVGKLQKELSFLIFCLPCIRFYKREDGIVEVGGNGALPDERREPAVQHQTDFRKIIVGRTCDIRSGCSPPSR